MPYSVVIPSSWDPLRQDLNDALMAMIAGFQAVVPTAVRKAWSEIPQSYTGETPLVYLGEITEGITHDSGLRTSLFTGLIGYVDVSPDNQEANTRANSFADYFREVFTANARVIPPGILQETGLREAPAAEGPLTGFMHLVLDYTYKVQEGRD